MITVSFFKALLFPPAINLLLGVWGAWLLRKGKNSGKNLIWFSLLSLWVLSLPGVARALISTLENDYAAIAVKNMPPIYEAIVVLGAGAYENAPEYGVETVDRLTLERVRYGAYLHHQTQLPLIASGGALLANHPPVATLMRNTLQWDYGINDIWVDDISRNTFENAQQIKAILQAHHIHKVVLVTHAWHMPRAVLAFRKMGIEILPAPTGFSYDDVGSVVYDLIPRLSALEQSVFALYEYVGFFYYKVFL